MKNWIAMYNPVAKRESTIFDRALRFDRAGIAFCVFEQMQLSHDRSTLYLVSPVSATSGSLAIVKLATGSVSYVHGVNSVYVIETGLHRDELIYERRVWHTAPGDEVGYPDYPFIHARVDGTQIAEISDEYFTVGGNDQAPILRQYLRKLDGTITVNGRRLP